MSTKEKVKQYLTDIYDKDAPSGHTLQVFPMWERDGLWRCRVNVREDNSWYVIKSWFLYVETQKDPEFSIIDGDERYVKEEILK